MLEADGLSVQSCWGIIF